MKRLFKLAVVGAAAFGISKLIRAKAERWQGLTESEVRTKLDAKLGSRMPDEKLDQVKDKVVGALRAKGKLREGDAAAASVGDGAVS